MFISSLISCTVIESTLVTALVENITIVINSVFFSTIPKRSSWSADSLLWNSPSVWKMWRSLLPHDMLCSGDCWSSADVSMQSRVTSTACCSTSYTTRRRVLGKDDSLQIASRYSHEDHWISRRNNNWFDQIRLFNFSPTCPRRAAR